MRETWVDDLLGEEPMPDRRFADRMESALLDEWRAERLVELDSTIDTADHGTSGRPRWGITAAAMVVLVIGAGAWLVAGDPGTDQAPATTPSTPASPEPTDDRPREPIVVPATGGVSLTPRAVPGIEPEELPEWSSVTAFGLNFLVLSDRPDGTSEVLQIDGSSGRTSGPIAIEQPAGDVESFRLLVSPDGDVYGAWLGTAFKVVGLASYQPGESGYRIVGQTAVPAEFVRGGVTMPPIVVDETGLSLRRRRILEPPDPPKTAIARIETDIPFGEPGQPGQPTAAPTAAQSQTGVATVTLVGADESTRSWDLTLELPPDGDGIFDLRAYPIGTGAVLIESYLEAGELRSNIVILRPDGTATLRFVRGWTVAGVGEDGVALYRHRESGVSLATADWPDD